MKRIFLTVLLTLVPTMAVAQTAVAISTEPSGFKEKLIAGFGATIISVITTLFGLAGAAFIRWVNAKTEAAKAAGTNSNLWAGAAKVLHVMEVVVADVQATVKPMLTSMLADGVLDENERKQLRDAAWDRFLKVVGTDGLKELEGLTGFAGEAFKTYAMGIAEHALLGVKAKEVAGSSPAGPPTSSLTLPLPGGEPQPSGPQTPPAVP